MQKKFIVFSAVMLVASSIFSQEEKKDTNESSGLEIRTLFSSNDNMNTGVMGRYHSIQPLMKTKPPFSSVFVQHG